jgi:hypothetical protein
MKRIWLVSLILIVSSNVFAKPFESSLLADNTQKLNSLMYFYSQNQSPDDTGRSKYANNKSLRLKDPNKALLYAAIPGFVVHGAGHFYAGKTKTGLLLLGTELVAFAFLVQSALLDWAEAESGAKQPVDPVVPLAIGTVLFYGCWLYDLFASPGEVKKRNEELLKTANMDIELGLKQNTYCLKLVKRF